MSLKTKGSCGKTRNEAGMCLKTNELLVKSGNVVEKKGCYGKGSKQNLEAEREAPGPRQARRRSRPLDLRFF
jgi:hypothetical protein